MNTEPINVLLIEDNPVDVRLIRELLKEEGTGAFRLEHVERLSAGMERLTRGKIDVILLDLGLPDSQGFDTFIKVHSSALQIPIVILSGLTDENLAAKVVREGAQDYLVKGRVDNNLLGRSLRYSTERKKAEEALRRTEENFRRSLDDSPMGIRIVSAEGDLSYANQSILDIYGYDSIEEMKATPRQKQYTPESYAEHLVRKDKRHRGEYVPSNYETSIVRKDGGIRHLEVLRKEVLWNGTAQFQVVYQDITERKRAEEALRESERFSNSLLEKSPTPIYVINNDSSIRYVNPALVKLTGFSSGELLGVKPPYPWWPTEQHAEYLLSQQVRRLRSESNAERPYRKKNGETIWINVTISQIGDGEDKYFLANWEDVTARRKAEKLIRASELKYATLIEKSNDGIIVMQDGILKFSNSRAAAMAGFSLDQVRGKSLLDFVGPEYQALVLERYKKRLAGEEVPDSYDIEILNKNGNRIPVEITVSLIEFEGKPADMALIRDITERKRAEEGRQKAVKLESIGTLAGGIAHDFNNVLTGILGNIQLANTYLKQNKADTAQELLAEAEKASLRARDITQQLLTFSRGGVPVKKVMLIDRLIRESIVFALRGSRVKPEFTIADNLWAAEADEGQLNQVINNLAINADQAMPNGGIINVNASNTVIKKNGALPLPDGDYIEIAIKDHGVGIPKSHFDRIFDAYFTTKQKGSGLGLATSYSIIKNHGGYITFESELGVGTTFHVYLPATEKKVKKEQKEVSTQPLTLSRGRILVMDDEDTILMLLSRMLKGAGYEVELSGDGAEAIRKYTEAKNSGKPFDAVILDLTVPGGMGGKEVIVKLLEIDPGVKAIVSSGYATDPIMADHKKYGFSAVVTKPYDIKDMQKTLENLLTAWS